jgi:hypothetical protein
VGRSTRTDRLEPPRKRRASLNMFWVTLVACCSAARVFLFFFCRRLSFLRRGAPCLTYRCAVMRNWGERGITAKQLNVKRGDIIKVVEVLHRHTSPLKEEEQSTETPPQPATDVFPATALPDWIVAGGNQRRAWHLRL